MDFPRRNARRPCGYQTTGAERMTEVLAKEAEAAALDVEWKVLLGVMLDATPADRAQLLEKRMAMANERAAAHEELAALRLQQDGLYLERFKAAVEVAEAEQAEAGLKVTKIRLALDRAMRERLHFVSQDKTGLSMDDIQAKRIELETAVAELKVKGAMADRQAELTRYATMKARQELTDAEKEIETRRRQRQRKHAA